MTKESNTLLERRYVPFTRYYGIDGRQITQKEWVTTNQDLRCVAEDTIGDYRVSTIYIGMDLNLFPGFVPVIFETMIFGPDGSELDLWQERYTNLDMAKRGHEYACRLARGEITEVMAECL